MAEDHKFDKYNSNISDKEVEDILKLWFNNPNIKNYRLQIQQFYQQYIENKYNLSKQALGFILRGERWKHIYQKFSTK